MQAWEQKLGEPPKQDPDPRRLDYLLCRGVEVAASEAVTLGDDKRSASDHKLVWADVAP